MKARATIISFTRLIFALLICAVALGLLIKGASSSTVGGSNVSVQDEEKSLDIARYPNEPLSLIDLTIRATSIKEKIKPKVNGKETEVRLDNVKFRESGDWFSEVKLKLRNTSDKPIYGLAVSLVFIDASLQTAFKIPIKESQTRQLAHHPLQPNEVSDLSVDNGRASQILAYMRQNGIDPNRSSIQLSVEGVSFGDDFGWRKGVFIKRNPLDPKRWDVLDKPESSPTPAEASRVFQPAGFKVSYANFVSTVAAQEAFRCLARPNGFSSFPCNRDPNNSCDTVHETGDGQGNLTRIPVLDFCVYDPGSANAEYCETMTFHDEFIVDANCAAPSPTPPPTCIANGNLRVDGLPCCDGFADVNNICQPFPTPTPTPTPVFPTIR